MCKITRFNAISINFVDKEWYLKNADFICTRWRRLKPNTSRKLFAGEQVCVLLLYSTAFASPNEIIARVQGPFGATTLINMLRVLYDLLLDISRTETILILCWPYVIICCIPLPIQTNSKLPSQVQLYAFCIDIKKKKVGSTRCGIRENLSLPWSKRLWQILDIYKR